MSESNNVQVNGASSNDNGHATQKKIGKRSQLSAAEKKVAKAALAAANARAQMSKEKMPAGLSIGQQALWLASRSGKSKPSVKYTKPKTDDGGFVTSPVLSIRAPGKFTAPALVQVCETQAEKSVGGISTKEADADEGWVHGEQNVRGKDMANSIRLLHSHGLVK